MWQSLPVTDIQHNYVLLCAREKERCVNLETTTGHDCMWGSACEWCLVCRSEQVGHNPADFQAEIKLMSSVTDFYAKLTKCVLTQGK